MWKFFQVTTDELLELKSKLVEELETIETELNNREEQLKWVSGLQSHLYRKNKGE